MDFQQIRVQILCLAVHLTASIASLWVWPLFAVLSQVSGVSGHTMACDPVPTVHVEGFRISGYCDCTGVDPTRQFGILAHPEVTVEMIVPCWDQMKNEPVTVLLAENWPTNTYRVFIGLERVFTPESE